MGSEQTSEDAQTVIFPITFSRGCFSLITGTILSASGSHNDSMWQVATVERERAVLFHQYFSPGDVGRTKPTYIAIGV
ncbi:gp53-like domain-containing protein [Selenomonas sp. oral taxon 136]|uniref:gp53-like domain-containing protein n=1 Tax=Selenomonas sp. oral taxon 136 TaxID=713030 RepID=UPI003FA79058